MPLFPPNPTPVSPTIPSNTYRAIINTTTGVGQAIEVVGSATKAVSVTKIVIGANVPCNLSLILQSAISIGASATAPITLMSLANPSATAIVKLYPAIPTPGTTAGYILYPPSSSINETFSNSSTQAPTLNGNTQSIVIGTSVAVTLTGYIEWIEV